MAEPAEYGLTEADLKTLRWVVQQVRSGTFNTDGGAPYRPRTPFQTLIGKPATAFTAGALTAPNNVVNLWGGPWVSGDAATGSTIEVAWSTGAFATTDYVILTLINGVWVVSCFPNGT